MWICLFICTLYNNHGAFQNMYYEIFIICMYYLTVWVRSGSSLCNKWATLQYFLCKYLPFRNKLAQRYSILTVFWRAAIREWAQSFFFLEKEKSIFFALQIFRNAPVHWLELQRKKKKHVTTLSSDQIFSLAKERADLACGFVYFSVRQFTKASGCFTSFCWKSWLTTEQ